jgi:hypothetical protein
VGQKLVAIQNEAVATQPVADTLAQISNAHRPLTLMFESNLSSNNDHFSLQCAHKLNGHGAMGTHLMQDIQMHLQHLQNEHASQKTALHARVEEKTSQLGKTANLLAQSREQHEAEAADLAYKAQQRDEEHAQALLTVQQQREAAQRVRPAVFVAVCSANTVCGCSMSGFCKLALKSMNRWQKRSATRSPANEPNQKARRKRLLQN